MSGIESKRRSPGYTWGPNHFVPLVVQPRTIEYAPPLSLSTITEPHVTVENDSLMYQSPNRFEINRQEDEACNNNKSNVKREDKTTRDNMVKRKEENLYTERNNQ